jgi:hypothetical protein
MPFNYLKKIKNVSSFYTWEDHISVNFKNKADVRTCMFDGIMQNAIDAQEAYLYNGWLQLSNDSTTRIVHLMQPELSYIIHRSPMKDEFSCRGINKDLILIGQNMRHTESHAITFDFFWYNLVNDKTITPVPKMIPMIFSFYTPWGGVFISKDKVALYNDELELCWQLDLSMYKRPANNPWESVSKHTLGPWNDKLYVVVHYEKPNIMEIDPLNGAILREWGQLPEEHIYEVRGLKMYTLPHLERTFLDKEKNVLGCLSKVAYWEIDLLTGEFSMVNLQQMFEELELEAKGRAHDPDYVYFTAVPVPDVVGPKADLQYVGAYNRHTHQIDWLHTIPNWSKEGWLNEIQKAGNRLYVKSAKGYLHIFEKN